MSRSVVNSERENIPGVAVTITGFSEVARMAAKSDGLADMAVAEYPVAIGIQDPDEIKQTIRDHLIDQIVEGLTGGAAADAAGTSAAGSDGIAFEGSLDDIQRHFEAQEWSGRSRLRPTDTGTGGSFPTLFRPCRRTR